DGSGYSFTQFEANEAREAFPCWDEPAFKIPFQLALTVPEKHEAVSNTPFVSEKTADGWKTVTFAKTPPLPSYLLAIATGTLEFVDIPGMSIPGRVVTVAGKTDMADEAIASTPPILAALEKYFGQQYPFKKLDLIAVPEFWAGAMENVGAVTYRETLLLINPEKASVSQKARLASVTAHELAHMWFGDMVTMEWWDDLWLNESFATWMGNKITDEVFPEYGNKVSNARSASRVMVSDSRPSSEAIRRPVENEDELMRNIGAVYQKGHAALAMFESWIGSDAFREGVLDYLEANKWGNATAEDLFLALSKSSGKDINAALGTFIEQPGVPMVEVELGLDRSVTLKQSRFSTFGVAAPKHTNWSIPVELKYYDGSSVRSAATMLDSETKTITLEADGDIQWALPNAGFKGYYRWNVPPEMLATIAEAAPERLTPRERIGYLGNLSALLDAGKISGGDYLKAVRMFGSDEHPAVVRAALSGLGKVESAFVTDELKPSYAAYVRHTLSPAMNRFGMAPSQGEDETVAMIRPLLIGTLADAGRDKNALEHCVQTALKYLENPSSVDPALIGAALQVSAMNGDRALFDDYRRRFENASDPSDRRRFLSTLGHFKNPELRQEALRYAMEGPLRPQEFFSIPFSIASTSAEDADFIFEWMMEKYDEILKKVPPQFKAFFPSLAGGCSKERLEAAREFFAAEERQAPGIEVQLAKVTDQVTDCVSLREREGKAVAAYLSG
ncbi:MAG: M1 family aminopeptidase, partial [Candidatus Zixiibacteriota bacterium]